MTKPYRIFIGGRELVGWTSSTLTRKKADLTGSLEVNIFLNYMPQRPIESGARAGEQILVYVGQQLAFTGIIDNRDGGSTKGAKGRPVMNGGIETQFGSDGYRLVLSARGSAKYLVDSSHQHPTTNLKNTSSRQAAEKLVEPWGIELEWSAQEVEIPILRLRDGGNVCDELHHVSNEYCAFMYETRDGKLRVTDQPGQSVGVPLVLGENILSFSASQSEDKANSEITIKGQRQDIKAWGPEAINRVRTVRDGQVEAKIPLTIQAYSDATDENLDRRGKFEADKRTSQSKRVTVEVFHVQQPNGEPWDLGQLHYVEIPSEGVFDVLETIELTYSVEAEGTLKTSLVMAPPASGGITGGAGLGAGGLLTKPLAGLADALSRGAARRAQLGVPIVPGRFPASWGPANLLSVVQDLAATLVSPNALLQVGRKQPPPATLEPDT